MCPLAPGVAALNSDFSNLESCDRHLTSLCFGRRLQHLVPRKPRNPQWRRSRCDHVSATAGLRWGESAAVAAPAPVGLVSWCCPFGCVCSQARLEATNTDFARNSARIGGAIAAQQASVQLTSVSAPKPYLSRIRNHPADRQWSVVLGADPSVGVLFFPASLRGLHSAPCPTTWRAAAVACTCRWKR